MKRNQAIDGWRGVSVIFVIFGHLINFRFANSFYVIPFHEILSAKHIDITALSAHIAVNILRPFPMLGVDIFFVISGYLITTLLWNEEQNNNKISISAFYVRRIGRIVPAFLLYMATIALLKYFDLIALSNHSFFWSGLYLCNLPIAKCDWWLGHTWSLAVEEQFYIVWPLVFYLVSRRARKMFLAVLLVALCALSPFFQFSLISFAMIAIGALYASSEFARVQFAQFSSSKSIVLCAVIILMQPFFASSILYQWIEALKPVMVAMIFFATMSGIGPFVAIINLRWLQIVGLSSYSIYLWQQLSTGPVGLYASAPLLLIPALFIIPAIISYRLVEIPFMRLAHRLSVRLNQSAERHSASTARFTG